MKPKEFVFYCEDLAMAALPVGFPRPERKMSWTMLQLHYGDPLVHFELLPHTARRQVECGLHFEGAPEQNDAWALRLADRAVELMAALGAGWELEEWTASWRRLHRVFHADPLTGALGREVAAQLALAIVTLQPIIGGAEVPLRPAPVAPPVRAATTRRWEHRGRVRRTT